jgi:hypothetical protein
MVGQLIPPSRCRILFIFDFGDWHHFWLQSLKPPSRFDGESLVVVDEHGEPFDQYPSWDD